MHRVSGVVLRVAGLAGSIALSVVVAGCDGGDQNEESPLPSAPKDTRAREDTRVSVLRTGETRSTIRNALSSGVQAQLKRPSHIALAGRFGDREIFVSEGTDQRVCILAFDIKQGASDVSNCVERRQLGQSAIVFTEPFSGTAMRVTGLAADGFSTATVGPATTQIRNNVFVLERAPLSEPLVLTRSSGESREIDLGPQFPPHVEEGNR